MECIADCENMRVRYEKSRGEASVRMQMAAELGASQGCAGEKKRKSENCTAAAMGEKLLENQINQISKL